VETLTPDTERCAALLNSSVTAFAAAYVPVLGYETVSRIIAQYKEDALSEKK
jgi:aspartate ammonia-lyase